MLSLVKMELLKLRKRPMTWIMLALLVGLLGLGTVLTLASARRMEADPATAATRERLLENITLPGAIPGTLGYAYSFGSILLAILAAAAVGGEYGWVQATLFRIVSKQCNRQ